MILSINNLITVELLSGIEATDGSVLTGDFFSYFTTEMTPMYSSVLAVRSIVGSFVTEISDDIINQLILKYSILAQDLGEDCIMDDRWLRYASEWVTYKVSLIILYNTEDFKSSSQGKVFKQLGDFSVSRDNGGSNSGGGISTLAKWLECEAFKYEHAIRNCTTPSLNCEGLTNSDKLPYIPTMPGLVEKGENDINRLISGRRWISGNGYPPSVSSNLFLWGKKYKSNIGRGSC